MSLTDSELRKLRDLLVEPFMTLESRRYFLSLAFPSELNRRAVVPLKGAPLEFTWQLISYYYHNDRNALLTILNVVQEEKGGDIARALQPFIEKLVPTHTERADADHEATPDHAIELYEEGNFEVALLLLEQLKAAGYRLKVVEARMNTAQRGAARRGRLLQLRKVYEDVALLARSQATLREARYEWLAFQKAYPEWRKALSGDPQNLIQRLLSAFEALRTRRGHSEYVFSVAWSPNRWLVASGSKDRTIHLWDAETGQLVCTLTGHTGAVLSLAWSPNGRYLASGSADGTIIIWGIPE